MNVTKVLGLAAVGGMPRSGCSSRTRPGAVADQSRRCRDGQGRFQAHHRGALAPSSPVASLAPQAVAPSAFGDRPSVLS